MSRALLFILLWELALLHEYVRLRFPGDAPKAWLYAGAGSYVVGCFLWMEVAFEFPRAINHATLAGPMVNYGY